MIPVICMCGIHNKKLVLKQGRSLLYYSCPNRMMEYRQEGESYCGNCVSRGGIREIKDELSWMYGEGNLKEGSTGTINIKKYKDERYGGNAAVYDYKVLEINEDYILAGIVNRRNSM